MIVDETYVGRMERDSRQVSAPLKVVGEVDSTGDATAGGIVCSGGQLRLSGRMSGQLTIESGAFARLSGQLNGPVVVMGTLDVTGQLNGEPSVGEGGRPDIRHGIVDCEVRPHAGCQ